MKTYADLTGYASKFPAWAAGFWQCKLRYRTQDEVLTVARQYQKEGIKIDQIVIDFFHWTRQGDFKFEPLDWPDPDSMVKELREMGSVDGHSVPEDIELHRPYIDAVTLKCPECGKRTWCKKVLKK